MKHPSVRHEKHFLSTRSWRPPWTADEWRQLERMRLAGMKWKEIARRLGTGRSDRALMVAWCRYGPSEEYKRVQRYLYIVHRVVRKAMKAVNEDPSLLGDVKEKKRIGVTPAK